MNQRIHSLNTSWVDLVSPWVLVWNCLARKWVLMWHYYCTTVNIDCHTCIEKGQLKLEQLERLRSEDTPRRLMITHTIESCWIPSQNKVEWPWRYRSRSKVITCDTPSHASNHLYQIWKESIQNYKRYREDRIFKVKAEWPWKYRSRSEVITCNTPLMLMMICAKYGKNTSRLVDFFSRWNSKNLKNLRKIKVLEFCYKLNTRHTL